MQQWAIGAHPRRGFFDQNPKYDKPVYDAMFNFN